MHSCCPPYRLLQRRSLVPGCCCDAAAANCNAAASSIAAHCLSCLPDRIKGEEMEDERLFLMMITSCVLTVVLSTHCSEYDLFELASLSVYCLCILACAQREKGSTDFHSNKLEPTRTTDIGLPKSVPTGWWEQAPARSKRGLLIL